MRDAAVIGMPNPVFGQRVAALVQLAGDPDSAVLDDIPRLGAADRLQVPGTTEGSQRDPEERAWQDRTPLVARTVGD